LTNSSSGERNNEGRKERRSGDSKRSKFKKVKSTIMITKPVRKKEEKMEVVEETEE